MEAKSLGDLLRRSCRQFPERTAMMVPDGREFKNVTYKELEEKVRGFCTVLRDFGLERGDKICIQCENCAEWAQIDWACQSLGIILVPIYPTLPADQTQYIVKNCEAKMVISSSCEQAEKVEELGIPTILMRDGGESMCSRLEKAQPVSAEEWDHKIDVAKPEDVATIIYTSGTTGDPKGAMLQHRAFTMICENALQSLPLNKDDIFLCFLPMSHVYERVAGQALPLSFGGSVAYAKSLMTLANDMMAVRPTIMLCVPRFLEATMDKIVDNAKKQPPIRHKLFQWAWAQGAKKSRGEFAPLAGILDKLVNCKVRNRTGGRMRFFVSGGAALPKHVAEFYGAFGFTILQGYGLTETAAASCVNHPDRNKYWTVGEPIPGVEIKIAEDGEILIKGPSRMLGYYNMPDETAAAIDSDGWFHTGDIGEFEGKHLKITDRKKDILVLANGKNVAPQPIENKIKESPYIGEAVLFGDGNEYVYALIIPNYDRVREKLGSEATDAELADLAETKALIKSEIDAINKKLADFEKIKKHCVLHASFSVDSGELTPSMKVRRKVVREKYAKELGQLERA